MTMKTTMIFTCLLFLSSANESFGFLNEKNLDSEKSYVFDFNLESSVEILRQLAFKESAHRSLESTAYRWEMMEQSGAASLYQVREMLRLFEPFDPRIAEGVLKERQARRSILRCIKLVGSPYEDAYVWNALSDNARTQSIPDLTEFGRMYPNSDITNFIAAKNAMRALERSDNARSWLAWKQLSNSFPSSPYYRLMRENYAFLDKQETILKLNADPDFFDPELKVAPAVSFIKRHAMEPHGPSYLKDMIEIASEKLSSYYDVYYAKVQVEKSLPSKPEEFISKYPQIQAHAARLIGLGGTDITNGGSNIQEVIDESKATIFGQASIKNKYLKQIPEIQIAFRIRILEIRLDLLEKRLTDRIDQQTKTLLSANEELLREFEAGIREVLESVEQVSIQVGEMSNELRYLQETVKANYESLRKGQKDLSASVVKVQIQIKELDESVTASFDQVLTNQQEIKKGIEDVGRKVLENRTLQRQTLDRVAELEELIPEEFDKLKAALIEKGEENSKNQSTPKTGSSANSGAVLREDGKLDLRDHPMGHRLKSLMNSLALGNGGKAELNELSVDFNVGVLFAAGKLKHKHSWGFGLSAKAENGFDFEINLLKPEESKFELEFKVPNLGPIEGKNFKISSEKIKGILDLDIEALLSLLPNGGLFKKVLENDYKKVKARLESKYGQENLYLASEGFVEWASPETVGEWVITAILSGGMSSENVMKEVQEKGQSELPLIISFLEGKGIDAAFDLASSIVSGKSIQFPEVSLEILTVDYRSKNIVAGNEVGGWIEVPHLAFAIVVK